MLLGCSHTLCDGRGRLAPSANRELGAKPKEMPHSKKGGEDGAIRVLKGDDKGGGGVGHVEGRLPNLGRKLCDSKVAIGDIVMQECLVALLVGMSL
jgi:hypothetical protein